MNTLRAASVQFEHAAGDKAANLDVIRSFVRRAKEQQVELICFPECCISGYWHLRNLSKAELTSIGEPIPDGPSTRALVDLAREHAMVVGAGFVELATDGVLYNSYVVAVPDGTVHVHRKIHTFISGHLASGSAYTVFDIPGGWRVGVLICYDNNIIENARITALLGADILLAPHQTGGCGLRTPHAMGKVDRDLWDRRADDPAAIEAELRGEKGRGWLMRWLPARAHDNGMFLLFSNGVGVDDDEIRTGNAMIIDPFGRIISETWRAADEMVVADLDPSLFEHNTGRGWIRTRRPDLYGKICASSGQEEDVRKVRFE